MYQVSILRDALKELKSLPRQVVVRISGVIEGLAVHPRPAGCTKLKGSTDLWRVRVGDYRIIYRIEDVVRIVEVRKIGHRRDVYEH